ncbi:hypothetical protein I8752_31505 [Nostocaceae cyanobacterium CENA369]|uniref:Uncharacterized protein n=1 Tax=Dendronalium phyllosphericum CENA369 TaxID=1725256 RepID=A0A8J7IDC5_9NOST|nr:hypothetical protein [Dendronalium phyllosphericum]MBH8577418.1 hypothetical protein [Dendronalium phyllosphericum CENA369]
MKLDSDKPDFAISARKQNLDWLSKCYAKESVQDFLISTWVELLELPSSFSFDEALLLCPISADKWLAWIPDYGKVILHTGQFHPKQGRV